MLIKGGYRRTYVLRGNAITVRLCRARLSLACIAALPGLAVTTDPVNGSLFCFSSIFKQKQTFVLCLSSYDFAQAIVADISVINN